MDSPLLRPILPRNLQSPAASPASGPVASGRLDAFVPLDMTKVTAETVKKAAPALVGAKIGAAACGILLYMLGEHRALTANALRKRKPSWNDAAGVSSHVPPATHVTVPLQVSSAAPLGT